MEGDSGEFSDELDEFEESIDDAKHKNPKNQAKLKDKPWDEEYEVSQDLSMAESFDGRDKVVFTQFLVVLCWNSRIHHFLC